MSGHPDDVWIDVSGFGGPELLLATDGREVAISRARALYVNDRIDIDELERQVEAALRGRLAQPHLLPVPHARPRQGVALA